MQKTDYTGLPGRLWCIADAPVEGVLRCLGVCMTAVAGRSARKQGDVGGHGCWRASCLISGDNAVGVSDE